MPTAAFVSSTSKRGNLSGAAAPPPRRPHRQPPPASPPNRRTEPAQVPRTRNSPIGDQEASALIRGRYQTSTPNVPTYKITRSSGPPRRRLPTAKGAVSGS
ncbi:hypothetical protein Dimus_021889 [Dionaea muscipula]